MKIYVKDLQHYYGVKITYTEHQYKHVIGRQYTVRSTSGQILIEPKCTKLITLDELIAKKLNCTPYQKRTTETLVNEEQPKVKKPEEKKPEEKKMTNAHVEIKKVFHYTDTGYTTVLFMDGSTSVVKCAEGTEYDEYAGFTAAITKRVFGSNSEIKRILDAKAEVIHKQEATPDPFKRFSEAMASVSKTIKDSSKSMNAWNPDSYMQTFEGGYDELREWMDDNSIIEMMFDRERGSMLVRDTTNGKLLTLHIRANYTRGKAVPTIKIEVDEYLGETK